MPEEEGHMRFFSLVSRGLLLWILSSLSYLMSQKRAEPLNLKRSLPHVSSVTVYTHAHVSYSARAPLFLPPPQATLLSA